MDETVIAKRKKKISLLFWGLILLFGGYIINTTFMVAHIHGYARELTRLITLIGLMLTLIGLVQAVFGLFRKTAV